MFDLLVKSSNAVWIYTTGRFVEERRAFLCDLNERGHGLRPEDWRSGWGARQRRLTPKTLPRTVNDAPEKQEISCWHRFPRIHLAGS
jgi:hypothetical protein